MSFLDEFNKQNNPSTQSNEPEQRKLTRGEKVERGKKRLQGLAIIVVGGTFLLILAIQGLGNLAGDKDKPAAFASVTETVAPVTMPSTNDVATSHAARNEATPTATAVPATEFKLDLELKVFNKLLEDEPYHVLVINQTSGDVVLDKDFAAGDDAMIEDVVLMPTAEFETAPHPAYAVSITSPSGTNSHVIDSTRWAKHFEGGQYIGLQLYTRGDKMDIYYRDENK